MPVARHVLQELDDLGGDAGVLGEHLLELGELRRVGHVVVQEQVDHRLGVFVGELDDGIADVGDPQFGVDLRRAARPHGEAAESGVEVGSGDLEQDLVFVGHERVPW